MYIFVFFVICLFYSFICRVDKLNPEGNLAGFNFFEVAWNLNSKNKIQTPKIQDAESKNQKSRLQSKLQKQKIETPPLVVTVVMRHTHLSASLPHLSARLPV